MKFITIINLIVRLIVFVLIYFFVNTDQDMGLLMGFQSLSFILGAIASILIVHHVLKIKFLFPSYNQIKTDLKEGWQLFLSTIGMNFYRESNIIILGIVTNYTIVGFYAPAEKLVKAIQSFTNIIVTALYPHFSKRFESSRNSSLEVFHKTGKLLGILFLMASVLLCLLSPIIIELYLGTAIPNTVLDLRILSFIILFGGLNYYYGIIGLVNMGKEKLFSKAVWLSGVASVILCLALSSFFEDLGAAVAMLCAEFCLLMIIGKKMRAI